MRVPAFRLKQLPGAARNGASSTSGSGGPCTMSSLRSRSKSPKANLAFSPDVELPLRYRCRNRDAGASSPCQSSMSGTRSAPARASLAIIDRKCLVCGRAFARKRDDQTTCGRPKCQRALRLYPEQFLRKWAQVTAVNVNGSETLINRASKTAPEPESQPKTLAPSSRTADEFGGTPARNHRA